ncbi:DUF3108 domain-containing protein [Endozoicomonas montiporae]|uniref:DUF3108 domain-containing protein n=1 Tax=Endozoicomonas montiporae CL-33 TaxID=570277 RepID=A0A142BEG0_9GAMM|nr:DUF3108 domain-containing protein [Endozoicomonas montiporae]AMO57136.1 hypothetical protein EZMO1_3128 [Endozoicomonas montiporae CL-33]
MSKIINKTLKSLPLLGSLLLAAAPHTFAASQPQTGAAPGKPEATVPAQTIQPKPFTAHYSTRYSGFRARGSRSLTQQDNEWILEFGADASVVSLMETTRFTINKGQVKPLQYRYKRGGLFGSKPEEATFDWKTMQAKWDHEDLPVTFPANAQDKLSYQYQLGLDLAAGKTDLRYPVIDDDEVYEREFIIEGEEVLETDAGKLNTVRVKIKRDNNKRQTWIWFAKDWDYVLVKFHQKDESEYLIEFAEGEVNGKKITGLKSS